MKMVIFGLVYDIGFPTFGETNVINHKFGACIHLGPCHTEHPAAKKGVYQPSVFGVDMYCWLVVSTYPSEKYEFVNWDDDIPIYYGKIKKCSKPPTSIYIYIHTPDSHPEYE